MTLRSSQKALDLVVFSEVISRAYYDKLYSRPSWPGGQSGITIAIGYDLGYTTPAKLSEDFAEYLPGMQLSALAGVCGLKGEQAHINLQSVRGNIIIPFAVAMKVFEKDFERYEAMLLHNCPGADALPADCFGALASIVYNRGAGGFTTSGDRFIEMRNIRRLVASGNFAGIPAQIRSMKRLWDPRKQGGLITRRENEAKLFEEGLNPIPPFLTKPKDTPRVTLPSNPLVPTAEPTPIPEPVPSPIGKPRETVTAKDLSGVVQWVDHVWWNKLWAYILGLPSASLGVFKYVFGDQANLSDYVGPMKSLFEEIPPDMYFVVVAAIAAAIFIQAKRAQDATVEAYRKGDIK